MRTIATVEKVDVAVVGASITGILVALGLRRRGASVMVFDHFLDNAALESLLEVPPTDLNTTRLTGSAFADTSREAMVTAGVGLRGMAVRLSLPAVGDIVIENSDGNRFGAAQVVYCPFGVETGLPWVANLEDLVGRGVSKDAWSDASFFRGQPVGVVGGDRRAAEQALIAAAAGAKPTLICPRPRLQDDGLRQRLLDASVALEEGKNISEVRTDATGAVGALVLVGQTGGASVMPARALFLAQGLVADWSIFEGAGNREPIHPRLFKAGVASGVPYWDCATQVNQVHHLETEISG